MKVRGLLLDVETRPGRIKEIEIEEENLSEFYSALNCGTIDIVTRKIGGRVFDIVCDDEGLFKEHPYVSAIANDGRYMLVGNLFICNHYKAHLTSLSEADVDYIMKNIMIVGATTHSHSYPALINVSYV